MQRTEVLPPFNGGAPLVVMQLTNGRLGVSHGAGGVWIEHSLAFAAPDEVQGPVAIPQTPEQYGQWREVSIGGVSRTLRHEGLLRITHTQRKGHVILFATHIPCFAAFELELADAPAAIGERQHDDEYGTVGEVVVYRPDDVAQVAAKIARCGSVPIFEDESIPMNRLGIERLDRIPCHTVGDADTHNEQCGMKRGRDDWDFSWVPSGWKPPLTWDDMADNCIGVDMATELHLVPQPLRSHIAQRRLDRGEHPPVGTHWRPCSMPTDRELALQGEDCAFPVRVVLRCPVLSESIATWDRLHADDISHLTITPLTIVQTPDGVWHRPEDHRHVLSTHTRSGGGRWVSATLTMPQNRQLLQTFYLLRVERVTEPTLVRALELILFHYMRGRGYTARWMGKYEQAACFVGNGDRFRCFRRLTQYAPDKLPAQVLARMCLRDGKRATRGSKGSRSKYAILSERYIPTNRIRRTEQDEEFMLAAEH